MSTMQALDGDMTSTIQPATDQYLTFIVANEEYGVDILRVQEIKGWDKATPLPNTPEYIKGVINLRGTIVPIIDLRRRFGLEQMSYGPTTVVIMLNVIGPRGQRIVGVVVDAVSEVYNVAAADLKPAPEIGQGICSDVVKGLATVENKMLILLDVDALMSDSDVA